MYFASGSVPGIITSTISFHPLGGGYSNDRGGSRLRGGGTYSVSQQGSGRVGPELSAV